MKTIVKALAIVLALVVRLVSVQAQAAEFTTSSVDPRSAVHQSGPYSPTDNYTGSAGFPLPGWAQLKYSNE
jgi:hypothetical protein